MANFILDRDNGLINLFRIAVLAITVAALWASIKVDYPPRHNTMSLLFIMGTFSIGALFGLSYAVDIIATDTYRRWGTVVGMMTYTADILLGVTFIKFANHQRRLYEEGKRKLREAALERLSDAELFRLDERGTTRHQP